MATGYPAQLRQVFGDKTADRAIAEVQARLTAPSHSKPDIASATTQTLLFDVFEPTERVEKPETIVFVPGTGQTSRNYYPLLLESGVLKTHRTILYDLEGHGRSPFLPQYGIDVFQPGSKEWLSERWARQLNDVIDSAEAKTQVPFDKVWIVTHSIGVYIAGLWATQRPQRVKGLFFINPTTAARPGTDSESMYPPYVSSLLTNGHIPTFSPPHLGLSASVSPLVLGMVAAGFESTPAPVVAMSYLASWGPVPDYAALHPQMSEVPVIIINGNEDYVNSGAFKQDLRDAFPDKEVVLEKCGHWAQLEKTSEVSELLLKFLSPE